MSFKIGHYTELDTMYIDELRSINTSKEREIFLLRWDDWLDDSTKNLVWDKKRLNKARRKRVEPFDDKMAALLLPIKILKVSLVAEQFGVPWGTAYIRLSETQEM